MFVLHVLSFLVSNFLLGYMFDSAPNVCLYVPYPKFCDNIFYQYREFFTSSYQLFSSEVLPWSFLLTHIIVNLTTT